MKYLSSWHQWFWSYWPRLVLWMINVLNNHPDKRYFATHYIGCCQTLDYDQKRFGCGTGALRLSFGFALGTLVSFATSWLLGRYGRKRPRR